MAKQKVTFDELMLLAKRYGLESNELFISCANQYDLQQKVIRNIKEAIESEESMAVSKEYVKNRLNVYANPLVKELPKTFRFCQQDFSHDAGHHRETWHEGAEAKIKIRKPDG